jgi:hypothetical protein
MKAFSEPGMKRGWVIALLLGVGLLVLAGGSFFRRLLSREESIRYHAARWHQAVLYANKGQPRSWLRAPFEDLNLISKRSSDYWANRAAEHERQLFRLGYITRMEFRLTNQILTTGFNKAFGQRIFAEVGTNGLQVWSYGFLDGLAGIRLTARVQDTSLWQRIFYECAALHASNLPPAQVTP